jgi:competence ComEA-like helix-hairpin-helix protein
MTPDIATAISDWRGASNQVSAGGAGIDYYTSLMPPYLPRNGPIQTLRELLMVRGVTPQLLLGEGDPQSIVDDSDDQLPVENGWAQLLTVDSRDDNVNAAGTARVDIKSADQTALAQVEGITPAIARAIANWQNRGNFQSVADLLDVTGQSGGGQRNLGGGGNGSQLIDHNLLMQIADSLTVGTDSNSQGLININTASVDVLKCLPGLDEARAHAIISHRQSNGFFANVAELLKVDGVTDAVLKQVAPFLTARSETFRVISEGRIASTGTRQRIQAILHVGPKEIQTLSYREDL